MRKDIIKREVNIRLGIKRTKFIEMRSPLEKGVGGLKISEPIPLPPSPRGKIQFTD